ncbi:MAG: hypothetical protein E7278_08650 [Lachnospiraceae bacterium]|nr:hypothetical protein [Lachnospiraceae bacterium]
MKQEVTDQEAQHQQDLKRIRNFRLMDDDFMNACLDNNTEATELLLRIILNRNDIKVNSVKTQKLMKNLQGRDIWLDIDAEDMEGKRFDIEVQRSDKGADRKRARYHSSIMDAHLLHPKDDFCKLPDTYVIFITERDVLGDGEPLYVIERKINSTGKPFDDGTHIIYVNGENRTDASELGKLMHDFFCTNPDDMFYKELAEKARYFKENPKGVTTMCKALEDMRNEVAMQTAEQTKIQMAIEMIRDGELSLEKVAQYSKLAIDKVKELAASYGTTPVQ